MIGRTHAVVASLAASMFLAATAAPTAAGYPEDWEPLAFELTLSGDVHPCDTFGLDRPALEIVARHLFDCLALLGRERHGSAHHR